MIGSEHTRKLRTGLGAISIPCVPGLFLALRGAALHDVRPSQILSAAITGNRSTEDRKAQAGVTNRWA